VQALVLSARKRFNPFGFGVAECSDEKGSRDRARRNFLCRLRPAAQ
jgi:hypothetical protein